jgi:inner membrane protease subunit 1
MIPTLDENGQLLLYEAISVNRRTLQRGDVVLATPPYDDKRMVVKRIVAMAGDAVRVSDFWQTHTYVTVPKGHVWLQGDNMSCSNDSRHYGPVPLGLIHGRVFHALFPWNPISRTLRYADNIMDADVPPGNVSAVPSV